MTKISNENQLESAISKRSNTSKSFYIFLALLVLFITISMVLAAGTLGVIIHRLNRTDTTDSGVKDHATSFVDQIKISDLVHHLEQLQIIADQSNGTRAIGTRGFDGTLDYITRQLQENTDFIIQHEHFTVSNCVVEGTPQLQSKIGDTIEEYIYLTDFTHILFTPGANFESFTTLVTIPNLGCQDSDWMSVPVMDTIAVVKRGECTFPDKSARAEKYRAKGLLIYNDGTAPHRFQAFQNVRSHMNATIPGYFLSYTLGMKFVNAILNASANASITMKITVTDAEEIGNICADTPTGNKMKTIVVGAHSDGVLDGSGINDNGRSNVF